MARQAVGIAKVAASCHRLCHVIDKFNGRSNRQCTLALCNELGTKRPAERFDGPRTGRKTGRTCLRAARRRSGDPPTGPACNMGFRGVASWSEHYAADEPNHGKCRVPKETAMKSGNIARVITAWARIVVDNRLCERRTIVLTRPLRGGTNLRVAERILNHTGPGSPARDTQRHNLPTSEERSPNKAVRRPG